MTLAGIAGKICVTWFGSIPRVIILESQLVREVLSNKYGHFVKAPQNPLTKLLAHGVASQNGERWATKRRILNPAFHIQKIKGMLPDFIHCCNELIERWEKLEGKELEIFREFQNLTADVISRTAFGSSYKEGRRLFELQGEQANLVSEALQNFYIPGFRFLPTQKNKRRKEIDREVRGILKGLIQRRENAIQAGHGNNQDLLGLLLESNNKEKNYKMTLEDLIGECKLFYFAGHETTSVLLTWTLVALSMHPAWQQTAREEVMRVVGSSSTPLTFDHLTNLKVVNMVLHEVLRLYPPVSHIIRQTSARVKLGGLHFPEGIQLVLPMIMIHHDRELWGDSVEEFRPERFSQGVSKASIYPLAFFPFGWGPRFCIGQNFAFIEAKMALAMILQRFSFCLSPSYVHAPCIKITMQPQYGVPVILNKL
ncbi:hypothetical protein AMTR_s00089p00051730 [Amborella trichopoda]|uniref:Cytochrome P450 n=1 Tax=Amborella trichopoda TaxID=13333 RepID=W1P1M7_AMBTC|nr:hypothetical protein AMTR_s00089p00051730 [Amborella trichopoda]